MELQAKIDRLETKIDRVEAKQERVEQALEEGTPYLGTTDHGELMPILRSLLAILESLQKQKEQLHDEMKSMNLRQFPVNPQQLGSGCAACQTAAPKAAVGARGQHHQPPMTCLPAPQPEQKRYREQPSQQQQQQQLIQVRQQKPREKTRQEQSNSESKPTSQHASPPPAKPDSAEWYLETQAPPPPPPKAPALNVETPAHGEWASETPPSVGDQKPPQEPKARPHSISPRTSPSATPGFARWPLETQAPPPPPPTALALNVETPAYGEWVSEAPSCVGIQEPLQEPDARPDTASPQTAPSATPGCARWPLETPAPPPPPPTAPALNVKTPAYGEWASESPSSIGNQEPPQEPKARPHSISPQTAPSATHGFAGWPLETPAPPPPPSSPSCTELSRATQAPSSRGAPARRVETPVPWDWGDEQPDSPWNRDRQQQQQQQQQQVVPISDIESTVECNGGLLPKVQLRGTGTALAAMSVEPASEKAAGDAVAPATGEAAGGFGGESTQPAGQREDDDGKRGHGVAGAPPGYPATRKTTQSLQIYAGEASSAAASTQEYAETPAADGQLEDPMQIFFKSPQVSGDKTMTLDVFPNDTVEDIKLKIQTKEGTPVHIQRLIYNCSHLENDLTVAQCGIQRGSTIHSFLSWSVPELSFK